VSFSDVGRGDVGYLSGTGQKRRVIGSTASIEIFICRSKLTALLCTLELTPLLLSLADCDLTRDTCLHLYHEIVGLEEAMRTVYYLRIC